MEQRAEHVLNPQCPWYDLKAIRLPNVKWCEQQLCGWIEEPANAWSNLAYILLGMLMVRLSRGLRSKALRFYGPASMIVGLSSGIYHASNNFILQVFDFFGMYVFCYLLILINFQRLGKEVIKKSFALYWTLVLGTTALTVAADFANIPIQGLVLVLIVVILATEFRVKATTKRPYKMRNFFISAALMLIAATFSFLDHKRIMCDPNDHIIQGHALWHVGSALALLFSFLHHKQFDQDLAA